MPSPGTGRAWTEFCDQLREIGAELWEAGGPDTPLDRAEGQRYLTRLLRGALEQIMEGGDARQPMFVQSLHETLKSGWDNPDNIHTNAYVSGEYEYRIRATRGDAHYMTIAVYGGSLGRTDGRRTIAYVDVDDLTIDASGRFEVTLAPTPQPGNWIETGPDATTVMIRQTFWDRSTERPAELHIERITEDPPAPLDPAFVAAALRRATRYLRGTNRTFLDYARRFREAKGSVYESSPTVSSQTLGIADMRYLSAWWTLPAEHAVVVKVRPPECRYWGFVLSNFWGESFDYRHYQIHTNKRRARYAPDGSLRLVICPEDPGLDDANWLDPCGHTEGLWTLRWLEATEHPVPETSVVPLTALGSP